MTLPIGANALNRLFQLAPSISGAIGGTFHGIPTSRVNADFNRIIQFFQLALRQMMRVILLMALIIGFCTIYDEAIGDGALPSFNTLKAISPAFAAQAIRNTTQTLQPDASEAKHWQAMAPSRELLTALSPEIAAWLYKLRQQDRLAFHEPSESLPTVFHAASETQVIAAYRHLDGTLYLGQTFWRLSDGQKAAVLAHEYRHSRQNLPKRISRQLAQIAGGGGLHYQSLIEDEAFAYERQAQAALGL